MKLIKIIIAIITLFIIVFGIIFIIKNKTTSSKNSGSEEAVSTSSNDRKNFQTQINTLTESGEEVPYNNGQYTQTQNTVNVVDNQPNKEDIIYNKISKTLSDWQTVKDSKMLEEALVLSESADNEVILESWRFFMEKNSKELIKIVNSSANIQKDARNVYSIFEWYVELSGDYERLSSSKKQEITAQYKQLKNILNIK